MKVLANVGGRLRRVDGLGIDVREGQRLLDGLDRGPSLAAHRYFRGELPKLGLAELSELVGRLRGRGGAGFPFAAKLADVAGSRRPPLVVNVCEGEPRSAKDAALAVLAPHLVLDGAVAAARALGSREVHVVVPQERPVVGRSLAAAASERPAEGVRLQLHTARPSYVSGQSRAVLELLEGRENKPVTSWTPATVSGLRGRPTLLSNAETFAQLGVLVLGVDGPTGSPEEPGTTLLTLVLDDGRPLVCEVELGTPWVQVTGAETLSGPALVGGYHGSWAAPGDLLGLSVSRRDLDDAGLTLGAGVLVFPRGCPLHVTADIADYLASQSAGRCGPCIRGLPTLTRLLNGIAAGTGSPDEVRRVAALVDGRGACAHPDGTARLVRSLLARYAAEVELHMHGRCGYAAGWRS